MVYHECIIMGCSAVFVPLLKYIFDEFYVYGSVHRWSILIIVQRDATQSSLFIILQVHSTYFGYQPHPSSGVHKTLNTATGTSHKFCAATSLQRGHKTVTTASGTVQLPPSNVANPAGSCTKNTTSTGDCSYSFVYSWWWMWFTPVTCSVNLQNNK